MVEEKGTLKKKDVVVELLRIIAMCMVIGTHVKLAFSDGSRIINNRLLVACFVSDGVAIF